MMKFETLITPDECSWDVMLKVLNCVGMWHYERSCPEPIHYDIGVKGSLSSNLIIVCKKTHTRFLFDSEWRAMFFYLDDNGKVKENRPVEGTLFSAFDYVALLLELKLIGISI